MKQFKVLSIDAWSDSQELDHIEISEHGGMLIAIDTIDDNELFSVSSKKSTEALVKKYIVDHGLTGDHGVNWSWNEWRTIGEFTGDLTEASALKYFQHNHLHPNYADQYEIDDDQYNLVLVHKKTRKPILAIEYGSTYI